MSSSIQRMRALRSLCGVRAACHRLAIRSAKRTCAIEYGHENGAIVRNVSVLSYGTFLEVIIMVLQIHFHYLYETPYSCYHENTVETLLKPVRDDVLSLLP